MRPRSITITAAAVTLSLAAPGVAGAAFTSAINAGTQTVTLNGDAAADTLTFAAAGGLLQHDQVGGGFNSAFDFDTTAAGDQTVPADGTFALTANGGDDNDTITVGAVGVRVASLDGGAGNDTLTGSAVGDLIRGGAGTDTLNAGDGDDRLIGDTGPDQHFGEAGNDTMIWNNGDGSDVNDGGAGADTQEVNGAQDGDVFTINPGAEAGRVLFARENLVPFTIDHLAERLTVNGLGGADTITGAAGIAGRSLPTFDGGPGTDAITGTDAPDLLLGGEGADALAGGAQDDRVIGNRGGDTMAGGDGDDTLVWNNGDGNDIADGDAGYDVVEVNGNPAGDDVFAVTPVGARARFERTNVGPFNIDIGAEVLDLNALGGNDALTVADNSPILIDADGGAGADTLTGANGNDSLLGGSGNDSLTGGTGVDVLDGAEGDDALAARDGVSDLLRGGAGTDSGVADATTVDHADSVESLDATPPAVAPAINPAAIRIGALRRNGRLRVTVSCPAGGAGCKGTLEVFTRRPVRIKGARVIARLGSARYDLEAGASRTLSVKLVKRAERLADRRRRLRVRVMARNENGATSARNKTVKVPRKK
jgi:Ca2+-binding RTX toxin-like protein